MCQRQVFVIFLFGSPLSSMNLSRFWHHFSKQVYPVLVCHSSVISNKHSPNFLRTSYQVIELFSCSKSRLCRSVCFSLQDIWAVPQKNLVYGILRQWILISLLIHADWSQFSLFTELLWISRKSHKEQERPINLMYKMINIFCVCQII